jgi:hypothetical protein
LTASLPFEAAEYDLEQPSEKSWASATQLKSAILAAHPRALEPKIFQHIWRGGSLPPGYS